jgi:HSP20 family molecular chaperone IbpA
MDTKEIAIMITAGKGTRRQSPHGWLTAILLAALLPVPGWAQGPAPSPADGNAPPYTGPMNGPRTAGALHIQTGVTGNGYYARIRLDGLRPDDIRVYPRRGYLVVQVEEGARFGRFRTDVRRGSWQMHMRRLLRLPYAADTTRMTMRTEKGLMEVFLPFR